MINYITKTFNFILGKFKARFNFWLTLLVIPAFFVVPGWWLLTSFLIYRIFESIHIVIYHEFQNHRLLRPRNAIVEFIGYYIIAAVDIQSPYNKIKYHWVHHKHFEDPKLDFTQARLDRVKYFWHYLIDLGPHAPHYSFDESEIKPVDSPVYQFFQKYWLQVFLLNIILWISLTSYWVFIAWFVFPVWAWGVIFRMLNWCTHKMKVDDKDYLVLLYGGQAWHKRHHKEYLNETETYYGNGIWKWLNIDFYVQSLLCKPYKG